MSGCLTWATLRAKLFTNLPPTPRCSSCPSPPCPFVATRRTGLAQAVGGGMLGVITASNYATIKHFPTGNLPVDIA